MLNYQEPSCLIYENKVIECLKFQGFSDFAVKAEIPINDLRTSFSLKSQFETYNYTKYYDRMEKVINNHIEFDFKVLTSDFWNFKDSPYMEPPSEVNSMQFRYEEFFFQRYRERKIVWKNAVGKSSLYFSLPHFDRRKELVLTNVQACLCLNLETHGTLDMTQITNLLKFKDLTILTTELKGLMFSKIVLSSNNEKVKDKLLADSVYRINREFKSKRNQIKVKAFKILEEEKKEVQ